MANAAPRFAVGKKAHDRHAGRAAAQDVAACVAGCEEKIAAERRSPLRILRDWRSRGLRVGFNQWLFRHPASGHVKVLTAARGACDRLGSSAEQRCLGAAAEG